MNDENKSLRDLQLHLASGYKLVHFCSEEETRAELELSNIARAQHASTDIPIGPREFWVWTDTVGWMKDGDPSTANGKTRAPEAALHWVLEYDAENGRRSPSLFVMKDLHRYLGGRSASTVCVRKLKDVATSIAGSLSAILLLSGRNFQIPPELEKQIVIIDFALPSHAEILATFRHFADDHRRGGEVDIRVTEDDLHALASAAQGMTLDEAELAISKALVFDRVLDASDVQTIANEKKQLVRKSGILRIETPDSMSEVGGLEELKAWLAKRRGIFSEDARRFGIPAPKGVLLTGIPGCGKSLCARAMAADWQLPILRLDMGAVFAGIVGSSEANMRRVIDTAEAMAPCILMIDEIEKGLAGMGGGGGGDGGTGSRVFGTLLSWMNDKTLPVFIVATSNQFDQLPPEMLRKGRFDELFFVDFPNRTERAKILEIHVRKMLERRKEAKVEVDVDAFMRDFDLSGTFEVDRSKSDGGRETVRGTLIELSRDFTGSEIEESVKAALIDAFSDGERELTPQDIARAMGRIVPLIETMHDKIERIRMRADECMVRASRGDGEDAAPEVVATAPAPTGSDAPSRGGRLPLLDIRR